ncbi:MAG: hypothetical protein KGL18_20900 [Burkholderiales bacterium]|nr:hypothetical protein [Burkholderiales bacterium]MDE1928202.1 hypothetical protein [Burkholderiales bacterium]MDE2160384.1 hypothetical protein [Burkholderiales bacterium]MDE2505428.1 hypothetical protein [Burkholderiales bacterium]
MRAGRALIGDEMGLGKTIQAVAAAELFARLFGVARVLVVCPISLKHQNMGMVCNGTWLLDHESDDGHKVDALMTPLDDLCETRGARAVASRKRRAAPKFP